MDIDEFYEEDPRRRASNEIELGTQWQDGHGVTYELNYVEDTGELYVMQEPPPEGWKDPFGGTYTFGGRYVRNDKNYDKKLVVRVVAQIESVDLLHQILKGWEEAMQSGQVDWVAERLRVAGVATGGDAPA